MRAGAVFKIALMAAVSFLWRVTEQKDLADSK